MNQQWPKAMNGRPSNASNGERIQRQIEDEGSGTTGFSNYAQANRIRNPNSGPGLYTGYGASHLRNPGNGEGSSSSSRSSMPRLMSQEDAFWADDAPAYMYQFGDAAPVPSTAFCQQTHHDNRGGVGMGETPTYVSQMNTSDYWIVPSSGATVGKGEGGASLMAGAQIPTNPLTEAVQESSSDKSASISDDVEPLARARKPTGDREPAHSRFVEHTPSVEIKLSKEREVEIVLDWLGQDDNLDITQGQQKTKVGATESMTHVFKRAATYRDVIYRETPGVTPLTHATIGRGGLSISRLGRTTISLARSGHGGHSNDDDDDKEENNSGAGVYSVDGEYILLDESQESDQESDLDDDDQEQPGRIVDGEVKDKSKATSGYRSPKPVLSASTSSSTFKRRRSSDRSFQHRRGASSARSGRSDGPTDLYDAPEKEAHAKGGMSQLMEIKFQKELELQRLVWEREDRKEQERKKEEEAKREYDLEMLKGKLLLSLLENGTSPADPCVANLLGGMSSTQASRSRSFQEPPASLRPTFSQTSTPVRRQASFQATPILGRQKSSQGSSVIGQQSSSQVPLAIRRGASPQRPSVLRRLSSTETPRNPLSHQVTSNGTPPMYPYMHSSLPMTKSRPMMKSCPIPMSPL